MKSEFQAEEELKKNMVNKANKAGGKGKKQEQSSSMGDESRIIYAFFITFMVFVKGSLHLQPTNREGRECRKGGQIRKESSVNTEDLCEVVISIKKGVF